LTPFLLYHYDLFGTLIAETTDTAQKIKAYLWHNGSPVAQIDVSGTTETLTYLHTDHLATARLATNAAGAIVWTWEGEAFGATLPDEDPDNDAQSTIINVRFPGQYFDGDTGLHYNYFRYYDPSTGRYVTSDPIGLSGGFNTYSYAGTNPIKNIDKQGLSYWGIPGGMPNPKPPSPTLGLAATFLLGYSGSVDISEYCERYLADDQIKGYKEYIKILIGLENRKILESLAAGESRNYTLTGQSEHYVTSIYALGKGLDRFSANVTVAKDASGRVSSSAKIYIFRYDWFTDPLDFHEGKGFGDTPFSPLPNLYRSPFRISIHCKCDV
jgi:RHS repeat-associated protein